MKSHRIEELLSLLLRLYEEKRQSPFPYDGCRAILSRAGGEYEHLISHLDLYFSEIAGYGSWGKKILRWPKEKVVEAKGRLSESFFEKHVEYKPLGSMITENDTPDLYSKLVLYESMRHTLLLLFSELSDGDHSDHHTDPA